MSNRRAGICFLRIDGTQYPVAADVEYSLGKPTREDVNASDGADGYTEKVTTPFIKGNFIDRAELDLDAVSNLTDSTVILELANEKTIALYHAWSVNPDGMAGKAEDANVPFEFHGLSAATL